MSDQPLNERPCRFCQDEGPHDVTKREHGVHEADVRCRECSKHLGFLAKPNSDKPKRPKSHREMILKFSNGICELCRTPEGQLPRGETLEAHHVDPYREDGEPTRENCWILCTACHKLVEWRRTYQQHVLDTAAKLTSWRDNEDLF